MKLLKNIKNNPLDNVQKKQYEKEMIKLKIAREKIEIGSMTIGAEIGILTSILTSSFGLTSCLCAGVITGLLTYLAFEEYGVRNIEHVIVDEDYDKKTENTK